MTIAAQQGISESFGHSCNEGAERRHSTRCLKTIFRHAEQAQGRLLTFARALAEEMGLDPDLQVVKGPLKEEDRFKSKARDKYDGHYDEVPDVARDRILFKTPEEIFRFRRMVVPGKNSDPFLMKWKARGVDIIEVDDAFLNRKKSGMVGINVSIRIDLGKGRRHICEIQIMHENMQELDEESHVLYQKKIRPLTDILESGKQLSERQQHELGSYQEANWSLYDAGIIKDNLEPVLSAPVYENLQLRIAGNKIRQILPPAHVVEHLRLVA